MMTSRTAPPAGPGALLRVLPTHRDLVADLTRREISSRYTGTMAGTFWSFASPLVMLAIYTLIFGEVFGAKWNQSASTLDFAMMLFAGLIVLNLFNECLNASPRVIVSQPNFVKKIPFPLEVFPFVTLGAALFHAVVSLAALVLFQLVVGGTLHWQALLLPLVFAPLVLLCLGLNYFLAATGVYLRDIGQVVGLLGQALLFLSPVFYSYEQAPAALQGILAVNPLTYVIEATRATVLEGTLPAWAGLGWLTAIALALLVGGFAWFQKTRKGFSDVM